MSRQTQGGTAFFFEGPCKILDFYMAKVLQGLFCGPGKGVRIMEKNRKSAEVDLASPSLADLDVIAQESYAEMLRLHEAGKVPSREYYEASCFYVQAARAYRKKAGELMQRYNQISDAFGIDAAETLVK